MCIYLGQCKGEVRAWVKDQRSVCASACIRRSARKSVGPGGKLLDNHAATETPTRIRAVGPSDSEDTADSETRGTQQQHLNIVMWILTWSFRWLSVKGCAGLFLCIGQALWPMPLAWLTRSARSCPFGWVTACWGSAPNPGGMLCISVKRLFISI